MAVCYNLKKYGNKISLFRLTDITQTEQLITKKYRNIESLIRSKFKMYMLHELKPKNFNKLFTLCTEKCKRI